MIVERQNYGRSNMLFNASLKCYYIELNIFVGLVYLVMLPHVCSGANQVGPWTDWSVCRCALEGTEGFTVRFRKPLSGSGISYKCHLKDEKCAQFEPCSCTVKKYSADAMDDHQNNKPKIPAPLGTPNESDVNFIYDRVRKRRNAFYNNYDYYYDEYGNGNYQGYANTDRHLGNYHSNRNGYQQWNAGKSDSWDRRGSMQQNQRNAPFDYNEYYRYDNQDYGYRDTGFTHDANNYYDQYQYGATDLGNPMKSNAHRTNVHMKQTGSRWNDYQGSYGGNVGYNQHVHIGRHNYYNTDQSYDDYGQMPGQHHQPNYGYEGDANVEHDFGSKDIPPKTVVKLQSSQQQILDEIRKLNERLRQSKEVMAHFTNEIEHLEELEAARQDGSFS